MKELTREYFEEIATAVFAGDAASAERVLDQMHAAGVESETIRRAKQSAKPQRSALVDPNPLRVPMAGHTTHSTLGTPKLKSPTPV